MPYTYSDLNRDVATYQRKEPKIVSAELMSLSLGKLPIPMLTITENVDSYMAYTEELRLHRQVPQYIRRQLKDLY